MLKLEPKNKYLVIETLKESDKLGSGILYAAGNVSNQYKSARVLAVAECDESKGITVGDTVLYDTIGAVDHTIGGQKFTTIKVLNVVAVLREKQEPVTKFEDILRVTETELPPESKPLITVIDLQAAELEKK